MKRTTFYWARLPVFGELGPKAIVSTGQAQAGTIERLDCVLDFVPKSRIFKVAVVIVERGLAEEFSATGLSGFVVREGSFKLNKQAVALGRGGRLPKLVWLEITGRAGVDDIGLQQGWELIVSETGKELIERGAHEGVSFRAGMAPSAEEITEMVWAEAREFRRKGAAAAEGAAEGSIFGERRRSRWDGGESSGRNG